MPKIKHRAIWDSDNSHSTEGITMTARQYLVPPVIPVDEREHPTLATVSEAAKSTGISKNTLYRYINDGLIDGRLIGTVRRIPWRWVDEFTGVVPATSAEAGGAS